MSAELHAVGVKVGVNSLVRAMDVLVVRRFESALCVHVNECMKLIEAMIGGCNVSVAKRNERAD